MIYFDTSVIVSALTNEERAVASRSLIATTALKASSGWVLTELASALAFKTRIGQLERDDALAVFSNFAQYVFPDFERYEADFRDFSDAAQLMLNGSRPLRSGDALHLAIVVRRGATLATLDRAFAIAARSVGVEVIEP